VDETAQQLEWEARAGRPAAVSAFLAAGFVIAGFIYAIAVLPRGATKAKDFLPDLHAHSGQFIGAYVISSIGMFFLIPVLLYLFRATRFRRPAIPVAARWLAIVAPIAFAILQFVFQLKQLDAADQFVAGAVKTNKHAEDLIRDHTSVVAGIWLAARVAIGFAFILISLNAMRAGLLSRFMGSLGVILGGLYVLPIVAAPLIQLFWLTALGVLFLGRWPSYGRGPAWETGDATPWPSAADRMREQREAEEDEEDRQKRLTAARDPEPEAEPEPELEPQSQRNPNARSRKRKKKSRR
jgi:Domain of unknown function (DUF4386)